MKIWKRKINVHPFGICLVKEYTDEEATRARKRRPNFYVMPVSHGFVNLFQRNRFVGVCGTEYAKQHIIKNEK